ncbi:hypothetical protein MPTK1_8g15380 [Marchantia polymorpha subsp. ruderalis]
MDQGPDEGEKKDFQQHLKPPGWKAAWEQAQEAVLPSKETKRAANNLVWCEQAQQSMGWLLLTQIGVLLGSFGQLMSQSVCLSSWGIFTLEAILKYLRSWAHSLYFRDVPCAIVALHDNNHEIASASLRKFGRFVLVGTLCELPLYAYYVKTTVKFWHANRYCYHEGAACTEGTTRLIEMLMIAMVIACLHWFSSLVTVGAFIYAMGMGIGACLPRCLSRLFRKRDEKDRLMCLTWWVHLARHRHLSAVVASAQPSDCGLPGHWFKSKKELFSIVEECDKGDHVHLDTSRLLWVSQEMALRALISLAKQKKLDGDDDFPLLMRVVRDGRTEFCRGLAATAIAVLTTQPDVLPVDRLIKAVVPLKRLARSEAVEHVEVALGALLNASLHENSHEKIIVPILESNEFGSRFMSCLIKHADIGHTTLCQELAVGLLSRLVGSTKGKSARTALMSYKDEQGVVRGVQLCTDLIKHGATSPIKAGGAAVLAEIAYLEDSELRGQLASDPHIEECIEALVKALEAEQTIAFSAVKALCSLAYNNQEVIATIVKAGGISSLVKLLSNDQIPRDEDKRSTVTPVKPHLEEDDRSHVVRSDAARALGILASNNSEHQRRITEEGAIPLLTTLMASKIPKIK